MGTDRGILPKDDCRAGKPVAEADATASKGACAGCAVRDLCLAQGLSRAEVARLDALIGLRRWVRRGQFLFRAGDAFGAIYALRSGSFRIDVVLEDGRNQVTDFPMPGDVLGTDGIGTDIHTCNAVALEDSEICAVSLARLQQLSREVRPLQHHLHRVMSQEIVHDYNVMALLGSMRAEERVATFLLDLAQRLVERRCSAEEFDLRMTRADIGSYLGLKLETVSRTLSRFQQLGILAALQKHIRILDVDALRGMVAHQQPRRRGHSNPMRRAAGAR
jgi:CRP/FNR family transcriptional regulator